MIISKIIAFSCVIFSLIALCGIVGAIENGGSLSAALWAIPMICGLWLVLRKETKK